MLDIRGGLCVQAGAGERRSYPPLASRLCAGADPAVVAAAMLAATGARRLYVADLDALTGAGENTALICALAGGLPAVELWVDDGRRPPDRFAHARVRTVYGSESMHEAAELARLAPAERAAAVLSLDRRGEALGPADLEAAAALWPEDVILMDLERVGRGGGIEPGRLARLRRQHPRHRYYLAGGVRSLGDIERAAALGAAGVLLASALHDGALEPAALRALQV